LGESGERREKRTNSKMKRTKKELRKANSGSAIGIAERSGLYLELPFYRPRRQGQDSAEIQESALAPRARRGGLYATRCSEVRSRYDGHEAFKGIYGRQRRACGVKFRRTMAFVGMLRKMLKDRGDWKVDVADCAGGARTLVWIGLRTVRNLFESRQEEKYDRWTVNTYSLQGSERGQILEEGKNYGGGLDGVVYRGGHG